MKRVLTIDTFSGGISESEKQGIPGSFAFGKGLDIYGDPTHLRINPAAVKDSDTTVDSLVKWIVYTAPYATDLYCYAENGDLYKRTSGGTWSLARAVASSNGQGLELYNDYLYYTQNTQVGRYGPLSGAASFTDNWQTGLNDTSGSKFAPIKAFKEGFAIGNGNDLAWYDGSVWDQDRIVLPPGFNIRSLEVVDEFLAIGAWRGTAITDSEEGYVFYWDGTSQTFNFFVPTDGGVNAMVNSRNRLVSVQGSAGFIYLGSQPFTKIQQLPKLAPSKYVEVLPGAITVWRGQTFIGFGGNTDSADIEQGVYCWGSRSDRYPEVLNFSFPISTGTTKSTTLKIGAVKGIGSNLWIGWRDGSSYGVDKVSITGSPYSSATYDSLIIDDRRPFDEKSANVVVAKHKPLVSGETVQLGYDLDRTGSFTTGTANSTVGSTKTRLPILVGRYEEIQLQCILGTSTTTSPTVTAVGLGYEVLEDEEEI